jgi:hypothetical protein
MIEMVQAPVPQNASWSAAFAKPPGSRTPTSLVVPSDFLTW